MSWRLRTTGRLLAGALVLLLAACSLRPPTSRSPSRWSRSPPPIAGRQVWTKRIDGVGFPLSVAVNGGVFTVAGSDGTVLALQADTGTRVWRASVGGTHRRRRGQRRPLRRGGDARRRTGRARRRQAERGASRSAPRVATAPLVAGERVFVLGVDRARARLRRARRPQAVVAAAPGRRADARAGRRAGGLQGHPGGRAGPAPGRHRPAARHACAGRCRWPRRVAPTRSSAWPTWSARRLRMGDRSARAPSRPRSAASNAERGTLLWTQEPRRHRRRGRRRRSRVRRRCLRPAHRLAPRQRRARLDLRAAAVPRPERAAGGRADGGRSAMPRAWCTGSSRDNGEPHAAPAHRRQRGRGGSPVLSGTTLLVVTRNGGLFAFRPE